MYIFDNKDFDATDFISCVKRGMQLIENRKEQMEEEGHASRRLNKLLSTENPTNR